MEDLARITEEVLRDFVAVPSCRNIESARVVNCLRPQIFNGNLCRCGRCLLCRVSQRSEWSFRLDLESIETRDNAFLTLTYDPQYVPIELDKRDMQLFLKRFRKNLSYKVRFFGSGEYGDNFTKRPHFHLVVFGLHLDDYGEVARAWNKGFVEVSCLSSSRCDYVCGYVQKKIHYFYADSRIPDDFYSWSFLDRSKFCMENGLEDYDFRMRPFAQMSRMPGIGANWYYKHKDELLDRFDIPLSGKLHPIPRYFRKMLVDEFPSWQDDFILHCQNKVYEDFANFAKKYNNWNFDDFYEWQRSRIRQREIDFKIKNELYLEKKREINMKKYGGNVL